MGVVFPYVELASLATEVGCKEGKLPFRYLGFPIGANMSIKENWKPLYEKFDKKLSSWKQKTLSKGGRLSLCKAVLGSLGVYILSLFKAPKGVVKDLEKRRRTFFWGSNNGAQKVSWVAWDKVVNSKENGGLGIGSIRAQNLALLTKWWWRLLGLCARHPNSQQRFHSEGDALWKKVIVALHGPTGTLGDVRRGSSRAGTWANIANLQKDLNLYNLHLDSLIQRPFNSGVNVNFWQDTWVDSGPLAQKFPRLAALDVNVNCSFAERTIRSENGVTFRGVWRRLIRNERERSEIETGWPEDDVEQVRICNWRARIDGLPTKENMLKRNLPTDDDMCVLCSEARESCDHVLVACQKAIEVRNKLNEWRELLPGSCSTLENLYDGLINGATFALERSLKEITYQAYVWAMWNGRNEALFNNKTFNSIGTALSIQSFVKWWCKVRRRDVSSLD
ncbi:hypothetical protein OSB04_012026 [Centaurea solstitialis]|uniref:Reverse transcriptase zinc-binding domain-containing protein n=1 Tax=Centaurea solstitialis TaxID=347529 RepID=A0AA38TTQ6_9ASTR|nr:hypothetical protein OSB04_012026 [Centaurea solstitialis]